MFSFETGILPHGSTQSSLLVTNAWQKHMKSLLINGSKKTVAVILAHILRSTYTASIHYCKTEQFRLRRKMGSKNDSLFCIDGYAVYSFLITINKVFHQEIYTLVVHLEQNKLLKCKCLLLCHCSGRSYTLICVLLICTLIPEVGNTPLEQPLLE